LGRSWGGSSTKIHTAVDDKGRPLKLHLTDGERHDITCAATWLEDLVPEFVIGEKGYDSDGLRTKIRGIGSKLQFHRVVIIELAAMTANDLSSETWSNDSLTESSIVFVSRLDYEKTAVSFLGFVQLASLFTLPLKVHTTKCTFC
jgi:hypothetical protein